MIYDQLFGLDASFRPQPQMLASHRTYADNTLWELTLREGLMFHDNTPVLARDCVASILRWARRDSYGSALLARADEIAAASDRVIRIRLKRPFAMLPETLAQPACLMMPERVAITDPYKQITDTTGSGPFRFLADERLPGSRTVYARFEKYVPRNEGTASFLAGPRVVHFDRVVWTYLPDSSTAAAALARGEYDWWGDPDIDLHDLLRRYPRRAGRVEESDGQYRLPSLQSPAQAVQQSRHSAPRARLREPTNVHAGRGRRGT